MNRLILAGARRGERTVGLMDRLRGTRLDESRQERLRTQLANYESAIHRGDDVAAAVADDAIEKLLNESRQARQQQQSQQSRPSSVSWDGGVRRPVTRPQPADMNKTILAAARERRALAEAARGGD